MSNSNVERILAFVDAPDPDNFFMVIALAKLFPKAELNVVLTGRCVRLGATKEHKLWDWDMESSLMAQQASAGRLKNFLRHFGVFVTKVYDGGIAWRTQVPHDVHFADYYKFLDNDPLFSLRYSELEPQEDLVKLMLSGEEKFHVVVGGPLTGLYQVILRNPEVVDRIAEIHAMFATWGNVELMDFGGAPRGAKQFNAYCDPIAANTVLMGLDCPIYLCPTEVTRVAEIGFQNAVELRNALPDNRGVNRMWDLYAKWYDAAVLPRQIRNAAEKICIHDIAGAFSLVPELRSLIYDMKPINVVEVPYLPRDSARWGEVIMSVTEAETRQFCATNIKDGGAKVYLQTLRDIMY